MLRYRWTLTVVMTLLIIAGCSEQVPDSDVSDTLPRPRADATGVGEDLLSLSPRGRVAVPDLTPETGWLGQVQRLTYDATTGTIFALQPQRGDVVEFSPRGEVVGRYGGKLGEGPSEIRRLVDFATAPNTVALLDRGNQKVLVFDRSARLLSEFRVGSGHRAIVLVGDRVGLVPGAHGQAIDFVSLNGNALPAIGRPDDLPVRCGADGCLEADRLCISCQMVSVGPYILVVNLEHAIITAFDRSGEVLWSRDFQSDDPVVSAWVAEDEPVKARMQAAEAARSPSQTRTEVLKSYFLGASVADGRVVLAVVPSSADLRVRGFEFWNMDPADGSYDRYGYPETDVGFLATGSPTSGVYALRPVDGGVYAFRMGPSGR